MFTIVKIGEAFDPYDTVDLPLGFLQHLRVQNHGEDKGINCGVGLSESVGQYLFAANEHVSLKAAYGLGPPCVDRAGRMFEVVQAVLAVVVWLGKFLQIG